MKWICLVKCLLDVGVTLWAIYKDDRTLSLLFGGYAIADWAAAGLAGFAK